MQHCSRLLASSQARGLLINMLETLVGPSKLKRKSNLHCSETKIKNIEFISTCFVSSLAETMLLIQSKWLMWGHGFIVFTRMCILACTVWVSDEYWKCFWSTLETRKWSILSFQITSNLCAFLKKILRQFTFN